MEESSDSPDGRSVFFEKLISQRGEHAESAIVGGAAADANQETPAALADGVKDQFSDTVGGSAEWIAFRSSQERKSGGSSHLDHRKRFALPR